MAAGGCGMGAGIALAAGADCGKGGGPPPGMGGGPLAAWLEPMGAGLASLPEWALRAALGRGEAQAAWVAEVVESEAMKWQAAAARAEHWDDELAPWVVGDAALP